MKTAKEWTEEIQNGLAVTTVGSQLETDLLLQMAQAIQLDAYKAGMTAAVEIVMQYDNKNDTWGGGLLCGKASQIRGARDSKVAL